MEDYTEEEKSVINELKEKLDRDEMSIEDVPKKYIKGLCIMYDNQIESCKKEISQIKAEKEEYKNKITNAIEKLKNEKNNGRE